MGGFMSNKMAIKHADRIKAIASVSGTIGHYQAFEPTGNINTMHIQPRIMAKNARHIQ